MFTVDRIIDNIIILENRDTREMIEVDKSLFNDCIKEGDIVDFLDDKYVINVEKTNIVKENIRDLFESLKE